MARPKYVGGIATACSLLLAMASMVLAACSGGGASAAPGPTPDPQPTGPHVIIIVQENRTPDDLFNGLPGADTVTTGLASTGQTIALHPVPLEANYDIGHGHAQFLGSYNDGKMDGFDKQPAAPWGLPNKPAGARAYGIVPRSEIGPYWELATQYAFGDRMFQSNSGPSLPAHLFLIAAQANDVSDNPIGPPCPLCTPNPHPSPPANPAYGPGQIAWGCDSPAGITVPTYDAQGHVVNAGTVPCFTLPTLADELDAKGVSWRYYAPKVGGFDFGQAWSAFDAIKQIRYGPDWTRNVISPPTTVLSDIAHGTLPSVAWVIPTAENSDHAGFRDHGGPSWVGTVVNALGNSPYWKNSVVLVTWDDWGGWYDHVPPPQVRLQGLVQGLGFRVPLIAIGPFAKAGYVSHVQYDFGCILKYVETTFGLPSLRLDDATANPLDDMFNLNQPPRLFKTISTSSTAADFLRQRERDPRAPDD